MKKGFDAVRRGLTKSFFLSFVLFAVIGYLALTQPLPYVVMSPGTAEPVHPMVEIERQSRTEKGTFFLTTVLVGRANVFTYLYALASPSADLLKMEEFYREGETPSEYTERQEYVMKASQSSAVVAAFRQAKRSVELKSEGIIVLQTIPEMPAEKVLKAGDVIKKIDGRSFVSTDELIEYVTRKKAGDQIRVTFVRNGEEMTEPVKLKTFAGSEAQETTSGAGKVGVGIVPATIEKVLSDPPVRIKAEEIGGPSAGLMFSLEIYDRLIPGDLTKGYLIAGTGTITHDGKVGPIGGVELKVVAADRKKADIFFVPKDVYDNGELLYANETDALAKAKEIGTDMKIIPVATLDEAIKFLNALSVKRDGT